MQLPHNSPGKRRAILLPLGLLMLSMAIFGWGLQYKLSLYKDKDSISHQAPAAKLLSQKERVALPVAGSPADLPFWPIVFLAILPLIFCQATAPRLHTLSYEVGRPPLACWLATLFVRPPPSLSCFL